MSPQEQIEGFVIPMRCASKSPVSARSHAITGESLCGRTIDTARLIDWAKSSKSFLFGRSTIKDECL